VLDASAALALFKMAAAARCTTPAGGFSPYAARGAEFNCTYSVVAWLERNCTHNEQPVVNREFILLPNMCKILYMHNIQFNSNRLFFSTNKSKYLIKTSGKIFQPHIWNAADLGWFLLFNCESSHKLYGNWLYSCCLLCAVELNFTSAWANQIDLCGAIQVTRVARHSLPWVKVGLHFKRPALLASSVTLSDFSTHLRVVSDWNDDANCDFDGFVPGDVDHPPLLPGAREVRGEVDARAVDRLLGFLWVCKKTEKWL
jgi:hypothetical protein